MEMFSLVDLISNVGMAVVVGAAFVFVSLQNNKKYYELISSIVANQEKVLTAISQTLTTQTNMLEQIKEELATEEYNIAALIWKKICTLDSHRLCIEVAEIKEHNDIAKNEDAIKNKLRIIISNLASQRNIDLDLFRFNGMPLSHYCNPEWSEILLDEAWVMIVDGKPYHRNIHLAGLRRIFLTFENEFLTNLKTK